jgi:hypothetical protein
MPISFFYDAFLMLAHGWWSCASRTCHSQQQTLAYYPQVTQIFSQQIPNQHPNFFSNFLRYKMILKINISWGHMLFFKFIYLFQNFQVTKKFEFFWIFFYWIVEN